MVDTQMYELGATLSLNIGPWNDVWHLGLGGFFFYKYSNNMTAMQTFYMAFSFVVITNKTLELGMWKL